MCNVQCYGSIQKTVECANRQATIALSHKRVAAKIDGVVLFCSSIHAAVYTIIFLIYHLLLLQTISSLPLSLLFALATVSPLPLPLGLPAITVFSLFCLSFPTVLLSMTLSRVFGVMDSKTKNIDRPTKHSLLLIMFTNLSSEQGW